MGKKFKITILAIASSNSSTSNSSSRSSKIKNHAKSSGKTTNSKISSPVKLKCDNYTTSKKNNDTFNNVSDRDSNPVPLDAGSSIPSEDQDSSKDELTVSEIQLRLGKSPLFILTVEFLFQYFKALHKQFEFSTFFYKYVKFPFHSFLKVFFRHQSEPKVTKID